MKKRILVADVGGSHVKLHVTGRRTVLKIPSGPQMTPRRLMTVVEKETRARGWEFDALSLGIPAPVRDGKIVRDPANLGGGWKRFDFARAARKPVRIVNDAAMQALGSYKGGAMLFLGFGTGLGSALIIDGVLVPMELAHLPYRHGELEDYVGDRALERYGERRWRRHVGEVIRQLAAGFSVDDIVLGGGNSKLLKEAPPGARIGSNACAMNGGERLWQKAGVEGRSSTLSLRTNARGARIQVSPEC